MPTGSSRFFDSYKSRLDCILEGIFLQTAGLNDEILWSVLLQQSDWMIYQFLVICEPVSYIKMSMLFIWSFYNWMWLRIAADYPKSKIRLYLHECFLYVILL